MTAANRGKYAEGKVREFLKGWAEGHAGFCFNRILDAHSAKGAMSNPQAGDFQWFLRENVPVLVARKDRQAVSQHLTRNGVIEVKEVAGGFRLPYKNFSVDQVGRLTIREMAGSEPLVIVCNRLMARNDWRAIPLEFFRNRDPAKPSGSWDLSEWPAQIKPNVYLEGYLS